MAFSAGVKKELHHRKTFIELSQGWLESKVHVERCGSGTWMGAGGFLLWAWISVVLENLTCLTRKASRPLCLLRENGEYRVFLFRQKLI